MIQYLLVLLLCAQPATAKVFNYETDGGAVAGDDSMSTVLKNGAALNRSLANLTKGDVFVVPAKKFYLMGGVIANNLESVVLQFDGTLEVQEQKKHLKTII